MAKLYSSGPKEGELKRYRKNAWGIVILFSIVLFLTGNVIHNISKAAAPVKVDYTQFQPINEGNLLFLATLSKGEVITVSYFHRDVYDYVKETYTDAEGITTSSEVMLSDKPSSITISGCNHSLSIVEGNTYLGSSPLYLMRMTVNGVIPCGVSSTVNLPLVENSK